MASTPPLYHKPDPNKTRPKSASRLNQIEQSPNLSLQLVAPLSPPKTTSPLPSTKTLNSPNPPKLHELLLLSPHRKSRTRLADRLDMADHDPDEPNNGVVVKKRCKTSRSSAVSLLNCGSPRINRRSSRKRAEQEIREERDLGVLEDLGKPRKRRNGGGRSKKEKVVWGNSIPSSGNDGDSCNMDKVGEMMTDLVMWNDAAKSSLWFGFGSLGFLSSCFTSGVSFSLFSVISQLGLLCLGVAFFSNTICQREKTETKRDFKLKEEDIVKAARVVLPAANLAISKTRELFSGDPSMTLKVAPLLLLGAEYGHLITLWRLCALGFFTSFTAPKLYSFYSAQINEKVAYFRRKASKAWGGCAHKKIVAASAATAFWNLTSFKTRIFAAFISMVLVRYRRQHSETKEEEMETDEEQQQKQEQQSMALVVVANG